ncbi:hypothetical protein FEI10_13175 [Lacticaseibacillus casei]|nr:hypothetical protein ETB94_12325 [Lacticaseibacillus casei]TLF30470.1 hypothetical protein FEI10_13175 [Lacticaseibacillus casei]TLF31877.1 hypothetical protein FEI12_12945 [Lacticaseibacillus casei]
MASGVMAALWPLRPRSLHAGFCAGERVSTCRKKATSTFFQSNIFIISRKLPFCRQFLKVTLFWQFQSAPSATDFSGASRPIYQASERHCQETRYPE